MKKRLLCLFLLCAQYCMATTWLVGPAKVYTKPSQVSTLVNDGDTVLIDAAVYIADVCYWGKNNLVLKGVGPGYAHLDANNTAYGGKAIWVIGGDNTLVENIEFSKCTVVDKNGAGIRQEGINLHVNHCYFHHNENGILAGDNAGSKILIEKSEFGFNGYGDGLSHNLYINHIDTLVFQYNYSHDAHVGHELKSRAKTHYILYNRISTELGTDSRNIDLPNGGLTVIMGNILNQQQNSQNNNMIGYGLEGLANAAFNEVYVINNTIINEKNVGSFFDLKIGTEKFKAYNNVCAGIGTFMTNTALVVDTMHNLINANINTLQFQNAANYQYQISFPAYGTSPLFNTGINAGMAGSYSLLADKIYVHPQNFASRCSNASIDIGAYEECAPNIISQTSETDGQIYPNPTHDMLYSTLPVSTLKMFDMMGKQVAETNNLPLSFHLPSGIYLLQIEDKKGDFFYQKIQVD
ncbi:MAG: T9SS type A sorting domain-containing protein [Bacteroidetes bacterium]|nr:T9SS type A sorting domain-containing protein [Bacteroidota bacterium]